MLTLYNVCIGIIPYSIEEHVSKLMSVLDKMVKEKRHLSFFSCSKIRVSCKTKEIYLSFQSRLPAERCYLDVIEIIKIPVTVNGNKTPIDLSTCIKYIKIES